jgi:hypothetical protein
MFDNHLEYEILAVDDAPSLNAIDFGNPIKPNVSHSLVSFYNQVSNNFIEPVNLPTINQYCFQGKKLPMLGLIDIRNDLGFRINITL